jgi:uncharacterized protein YcbK (DUF882 family)
LQYPLRVNRFAGVVVVAAMTLSVSSAVAPAEDASADDPPFAPSARVLDVEAWPPDQSAEAERAEPFTPFVRLPSLHVHNINTNQAADVRLYDFQGRVDRRAAARLDELLADTRDPAHPHVATLDRRALQLLFRTAYHFGAKQVVVVSAFRKPGKRGEGLHASARAIDFKVTGVRASVVADYLMTLPRVGVGLYTHPDTQFVHLDVRDRSYHWVDTSPPGGQGSEWPLGRAGLDARDAAYARQSDWPEGTRAPGAL